MSGAETRTDRVWRAAKLFAAACALVPLGLFAGVLYFGINADRCPTSKALCLEYYNTASINEATGAVEQLLLDRLRAGASAADLAGLLTAAGMTCVPTSVGWSRTWCRYEARLPWLAPVGPVVWEIEILHPDGEHKEPRISYVRRRITAL